MHKVMIDPGHGGRKPGAVNKRMGFKERDIVLKVANRLVAELENNSPEIVPLLTRRGDIDVSLSQRCTRANEEKADVFLSIHTNARLLKGKYGLEIETYYCRGSKEGKRLAKIIQKNLVAQDVPMKTIDRGIKVGKRWSESKQKWMPFYVLKHTAMPAVLVELGFLSDFEEAIILSSPVHQKTMGRILAQSLVEFFKKESI